MPFNFSYNQISSKRTKSTISIVIHWDRLTCNNSVKREKRFGINSKRAGWWAVASRPLSAVSGVSRVAVRLLGRELKLSKKRDTLHAHHHSERVDEPALGGTLTNNIPLYKLD